MSNLLFITSSLMGENSASRKVAAELAAAWTHASGSVEVTERHLNPANMPHLGADTLAALGTPAEARTAAHQDAMTFADSLIAEVEKADVILIAAPMYNFSIPSTLKAWLDHIARAGRTFRYTATGPEGLLKNKKVYVVASRGGFYGEGTPAHAANFQDPYLRQFWNFLGVTDITFIPVEGQAVSKEAAANGLAQARNRVSEIVPLRAAA